MEQEECEMRPNKRRVSGSGESITAIEVHLG